MLTKTLEQNNLQHRTHCTEKKIEKRGKDKGFGYLKKDDDHVDDLDKYKEKKKKIIEGYIIEEALPEILFTNPKHERTKLFLSKVL